MNMYRSTILRSVLLLALSFIILLPVRAQQRTVPRVGDPAPDYSLPDFQGKKFSFAKKKNKKVHLFWFTNLCSGCQSVIQEMEKIKNEYQPKGVEIVCVSQLGEDRASVERIVKARNLTLRFLYDPKGEATSLYSGRFTLGVCPLKSVYIVGKQGNIQFATHFPGVPAQEIRNQLDKALSAK